MIIILLVDIIPSKTLDQLSRTLKDPYKNLSKIFLGSLQENLQDSHEFLKLSYKDPKIVLLRPFET